MATESFRRILFEQHGVESAEKMAIGGLMVRVLPLEALIEEKKALGRDKDRLALRMLEALMARKNKR